MKFLAISGSLRKGSTNTALLQAFRRHASGGIAVELSDDLAGLPLFSPDREGEATPEPVLAFAERVARADGLIIASPEYAHGIPGGLKNGLDWLVSRFEIPGKPVMLVHASRRSTFVRDHLGEVLRTMSTRLHAGSPFEVHLIGKTAAEAGRLLDEEEMRSGIRASLIAFTAFAKAPTNGNV